MTYTPSCSDAAVQKKTGHDWKHWFRTLDRWGARNRTHREIALHLRETHGVPSWWSQMITGEYEKAHGLRAAAGEQVRSKKFQASVQRTVAASASRCFEALNTTKTLRAIAGADAAISARKGGTLSLPGLGEGEIRIFDRGRRIRSGFAGRGARESTLEITFTSSGRGKCAIRVRHSGLDSEAAYKRYRKLWGGLLDATGRLLE